MRYFNWIALAVVFLALPVQAKAASAHKPKAKAKKSHASGLQLVAHDNNLAPSAANDDWELPTFVAHPGVKEAAPKPSAHTHHPHPEQATASVSKPKAKSHTNKDATVASVKAKTDTGKATALASARKAKADKAAALAAAKAKTNAEKATALAAAKQAKADKAAALASAKAKTASDKTATLAAAKKAKTGKAAALASARKARHHTDSDDDTVVSESKTEHTDAFAGERTSESLLAQRNASLANRTSESLISHHSKPATAEHSISRETLEESLAAQHQAVEKKHHDSRILAENHPTSLASKVASAASAAKEDVVEGSQAAAHRLARLTAYWAGEGDYYTRHLVSATGVHLHDGHCAVDPTIIPYGSVVQIPGVGKFLAVDTGSAVVDRTAAKEAGRNRAERAALVVDLFFDNRADGERFAAQGAKYVAINWWTPGANRRPSHHFFADENIVYSKQL